MSASKAREHSLNAICPYFTMFPLSFPASVLTHRAKPEDWVLDPFCGRGTTNFAARLLGLPTAGIDSSPVGAAIAEAKLVDTTPDGVVRAAKRILAGLPTPSNVPQGEFWDWAFAPDVLRTLCQLREGLIENSHTPARTALRAVLLGALHGPLSKNVPSYFSNQCTRTYAPKPRYATAFWKTRGLQPQTVDVMGIVERRARRYFAHSLPEPRGVIRCGDSRNRSSFAGFGHRFRWVVTSPPYYGLRTYVPDQWLRGWFLGGPAVVDYSQAGQLNHSGRGNFVSELATVWERVREVCVSDATMVVRFGTINDRVVDPLVVLSASLEVSGWRIADVAPAGSARDGRRQADHFMHNSVPAAAEYDVWAMVK